MGKYNLRFIKPLISLSLGAAIITGAVVGGAEDASAATNYKISNGILVFKATKKVVKGTVTYKGKVYKNGELFTGTKGNTYYKNGKKATGIYKGRYYLKGKIYSGIANSIYYKNGSKATGTYKGTYYLKGKAYTGLVVDIYYSNGKKANGTYEGVFYLNGTAFTGLHPNTGHLYINGALNTVLRIFDGDLYNGARLNEGVIQYNGLWYAGKRVANGTITIPGGQIIIVDNGRQTGTINSGPGSYYSVVNEAIAKLEALKFYEVYTINHVTNLVDARRQYNEAKVAVDVAVARGAVTSEFGVNYWRLAAQWREIDRYEGRDTKEVAINKATNELARLEYTAVNSIRYATNLTTAKLQYDAAKTAVDAARAKGAVTSDFGTNYWKLADQKTEIDRYEAKESKEVTITKATTELARLEYAAVNSIRYATNLTTAKLQYDAAKTAVDAARAKGAVTSDFGTNYWKLADQKVEIDRYEAKESKEVAITKAVNELGNLKFTVVESIKDSTSLTIAKSQYDAANIAVKAAIAKGASVSDFGSNYSKLEAQGKEINRYEEVKKAAIKDATTNLLALTFYTDKSIDDATKLEKAETQYNAADTAVKAAIAKGATEADFANLANLAAQKKEINRYKVAQDTEAEATAAVKVFREAHAKALALTVEKAGIENEAEVKAALEAYDKLSKAAQDKVSNEKKLLDDLVKKIKDLKAAENEAQIKATEEIIKFEKITWENAKKDVLEQGLTDIKDVELLIEKIKDKVVKEDLRQRYENIKKKIEEEYAKRK
ncbi:hypothetical protein ACQKMD_02935 [Viridibacillus sp. NPDC096237]|uniref:hypothetical protein n=1 Tax=Viridibacillus sp. NPDC096237 TaxID=3390721 RepID=UPI003CFF9FE1